MYNNQLTAVLYNLTINARYFSLVNVLTAQGQKLKLDKRQPIYYKVDGKSKIPVLFQLKVYILCVSKH